MKHHLPIPFLKRLTTRLLLLTLILVPDIIYAATPHYAVILPLKGKTAKAAQFVCDGMVAAYFDARARNSSLPPLRIYDSTTASLPSVYQYALSEGAIAVAGPLDKDQVRALQQGVTQYAVPTLLLNNGDNLQPHGPVYQFALAPEDEIEPLISHARQNGYQKAAILMQNDELGERTSRLLYDAWQRSGGDVTATLVLNPRNNVINSIYGFMYPGEKSGKKHKRDASARRQDIDVIFLATGSLTGRQVRPALNHANAGTLPLYALSTAVDTAGGSVQLQDMEGMHFSETPWLMSESPLRQLINTLKPANSSSLDRLYAFGIDAFSLLNQLAQGDTAFPVQGMTGELSPDENGRLKRGLTWATIHNGAVIPETTAPSP